MLTPEEDNRDRLIILDSYDFMIYEELMHQKSKRTKER
jgi:hypothetical protein